MTETHLHIVTHEVPWPANYGGVVDLFYKVRTLRQLGVKVHLHCFSTGRQQPELNKYCAEVRYYQRNRNIRGFSLKYPFIVKSRTDDALAARLQQDDYPVLLDGIHCTWPLYNGSLDGRRVLVRLHNTEFEYYRHLALLEKNPVKKMYYSHESGLLKEYEKAIANKAVLLAVSEKDAELYRNELGAGDVHFLPVFTPYTMAACKEGRGTYCLYHGNLAVNENAVAAEWLLTKVFSRLQLPLVIAGRNPSPRLQKLAHAYQHTCMVTNPGDNELQDLIARAQINILPSFNNTGVKLKLINAILNGRHCLVNYEAAEGSGLEALCHEASDAAGFIEVTKILYEQPFTAEDIEARQNTAMRLYNNEENAQKLLSFL